MLTRYIFNIIDPVENDSDERYHILLKLNSMLSEGDHIQFTELMFKRSLVSRYSSSVVIDENFIRDIIIQQVTGEYNPVVEQLLRNNLAYIVATRSKIDKEGMYVDADIRIVKKV